MAASTSATLAPGAHHDLPAFSRFPDIDRELRLLALAIVDAFISKPWYSKLTANRDLQREIMVALAQVARSLESRLLAVDWPMVLLADVPYLVTQHWQALAAARESLVANLLGATVADTPSSRASVPADSRRSSTHSLHAGAAAAIARATPATSGPPALPRAGSASLRPSPAPSIHVMGAASPPPTPGVAASQVLEPPVRTVHLTTVDLVYHSLVPHVAMVAERVPGMSDQFTLPHYDEYLRMAVGQIVQSLLPLASASAPAERVLVREIVLMIVRSLLDRFSDPVYLFTLIANMLEPSTESSQKPSSPTPTTSFSLSSTPSTISPLPNLRLWWHRLHTVARHTLSQARLVWATAIHLYRQHTAAGSATTAARRHLRRRRGSGRRYYQLDVPWTRALDAMFELGSNPATRWIAVLWHLWVRPPLRWAGGAFIDSYLQVAATHGVTPRTVAPAIRAVTQIVKDAAAATFAPLTTASDAAPAPPPHAVAASSATAIARAQRRAVKAISAFLGARDGAGIERVLASHTLKHAASSFRTSHLLLLILDTLLFHLFAVDLGFPAATHAATASPADPLQLARRSAKRMSGIETDSGVPAWWTAGAAPTLGADYLATEPQGGTHFMPRRRLSLTPDMITHVGAAGASRPSAGTARTTVTAHTAVPPVPAIPSRFVAAGTVVTRSGASGPTG
ncbi:hypothetical protein AMAG_02939 [Allomyces macrogynus ATCC 38327]|uniref:PXA domain-containing protein n=1 Tax=Allomyces macrogynus (strain ATCC 38327) TaxID=578462 RepID=A0A0L0S472_ALLM3|nr:hypothetical protein AMAG_02939 [Allomyces macrogynus ATCC 38327]|eukprot:KNE57196.1 hypothetical protein AMAG_02939 [Allomyces macrogynus ATCC 38327]